MTPDEKKMIGELFERIAKNQEPAAQKDREAEAFIRDATLRDAGAAYTLVQMALVQEHALKLADERIRELEAKLGPAADAPAAPAKASFLDGLLPNSPWARKSSVPATGAGMGASAGSQPMVRPGMFGRNAGAQAAAPQGGSFLRSAFATAAGVAGGLMLFEAVRGLMANEAGGGAFQQSAQAASPAAEALPAQAASQDMAQAPEPAFENPGYNDPGYHDVASNDTGYDNGGSFGGDDFA